MATLNLTLPDGRSVSAQVGDNFASLSDADKEATIHEITNSVPAQSWSGDIQGGLHDLGTAVSQGAKAIGGVMSRNGMPEWGGAVANVGKDVDSITPSAPAGPSPGETLTNDFRSGNWRGALSELPHAALRALPSTAPILAAGAFGGPIAAGAAAGAEALGPTAYARAANNNRQEPTTSDVVESLPNVAAQGAIGSFLPGGAASKIANPVLRAGAKAAIEGVAGGGMDLANQAGTTAGTDKGLTIDPYETAGAAATQGAIGAGRGAKELAQLGIKSGVDNVMARTLPTTDDVGANSSTIRVTNAMNKVQAQRQAAGSPVSDAVAANAVKDGYVDRLNSFITGLMAAKAIDKTDYTQLRNAMDAAQRHNNTLSDGQLSHIDGLEIDPDAKAFLKENLTDLNTASTQSFLKNQTGPFAKIGGVAGKIAGLIGGAHLGLPGLATAVMGSPLEAKIGQAAGGVVDRMLGTNTAPIVLQRINALRALKAAGVDPNSIQPTQVPQLPEAPPAAPSSSRVPPFIRPGPNNTINPAPAPAAPSPAPPFIRPRMAPPPAPAPAPGFIRPNASNTINAAPQTPSEPSTPAPNPVSVLMRAKQLAAAQAAQRAAETDAVGNPVDRVPVNTPIRAKAPLPPAAQPVAPPLPPALQVNTPADVAMAMRQDDGAAPAALQAPQAPARGAASSYVGNPLGASHEEVLAAAKGTPYEGLIANGGATPIDPTVAKQLQARIRELRGVGIPAGGNQGYAVEHSHQARVNASGYQSSMDLAASSAKSPADRAAILDIKMTKNVSEKQAKMAAYEQQGLGPFPSWMGETGQR